MHGWLSISERLQAVGIAVDSGLAPTPVGGGDINAAWRAETDSGSVFLKTGAKDSLAMFSAEAEGLTELAAAKALRVPEVLATGQTRDHAFLALEWLPFERSGPDRGRLLGERLAKMHRTTSSRFGWHRDNTIGLTPQHNSWCDSWLEFFAEHRLGFQLMLAAQNGFGGALQERGERLLARLPMFFEHHAPLPSLLHGDLWGGNWASCDGEPVIFDPAVYYGDRETDIAMTRLFGGFGSAFYDAYETAWPLPDGSPERQQLYQLYHVLNHLNLFGAGYLGRAEALITALL